MLKNILEDAIGDDEKELFSERNGYKPKLTEGRNSLRAEMRAKIPQIVEEVVKVIQRLKNPKIRIQTQEDVSAFTGEVITIPLDQENAVRLEREVVLEEIIKSLTVDNSKEKDNK